MGDGGQLTAVPKRLEQDPHGGGAASLGAQSALARSAEQACILGLPLGIGVLKAREGV